MENILNKVGDAALQKPVELEVDIISPGRFQRILQHLGLMAKKRKLVLHPITLGNLIRISQQMLAIDINLFRQENLLESNYKAIQLHGNTIARIIAIAVNNSKSDPPASLVRFIVNNFTAKELLQTLGIVLRQMNITDFMTSIISVRGLNVLEASNNGMSPVEQGSSIAPGTSSGV